MMANRVAQVLLSGQPVGVLREVDDRTSFEYAKEWLARGDAAPVSVTMPLRSEPYVSPGLHPFFENLLPEGWLLEVSSRKLKISADDPFGLLLATCGDCIGAVEIAPLESGPSP
jgi:serine/threonine-protein kinase HipA